MFLYKCPYDFFFGLSCPGCGMTRAFISLVKFDFEMAFYYHPLFPVVIIFVILALLDYFKIIKLSDRVKRCGLWTTVILFFAVYAIRLFSGSEVVYFRPEDSLFVRIYNFICVFIKQKTL